MKALCLAMLFLSMSAYAQDLPLPSPGQTTLKVYSIYYANPSETAEMIKMMMPSTNGLGIQVADRRLAVRGTVEQHTVAEQMLRELDKPPKNIQINVQFNRTGRSSSREAGIRPKGSVVIQDGEVHGSMEGRLSDQSTTSSENVTQMLVTMEGHSATLQVGERVPHLAWLMEYGWRHGYIREVQIEWRDVGSFLTVEPEIIGDGPMIRIRLTPTLSGRLTDGTEQTIQFTAISTEVITRDGQPVSIGELTKDEEFSSRFLIGRSGGGQSSVTDITLTPRILQ